MSERWPLVSLGELLRLERRRAEVRADSQYQEIGIYCFGRGIFHKAPRSGLEVGDKALFLMKEGDFILQVTFAWEGAVAIVSAAEEGMYGSTRYPTFRVDEARCVPNFLLNYFKTHEGLQQLIKICPGSAGRNRVLSIRRIPEVLVPLPPLAEQRRVVARIEELAAQIHEARALRRQAAEEAEKILFAGCEATLREAETRFSTQPLSDATDKDRGISYGVVLTGQDVDGGIPTLRAGDLQWFECKADRIKRVAPEIERGYQRTRLQGGELLLRIRGGVGALAVCPEHMIGGNVSREIAVIPLTEQVDARFVMFLLAAPTNQARMLGHVKGTSYVGINLKDVRTLRLPFPPLPEQRRIVAELDALQAEVDALKRLQAETAAELDALLPAVLDQAFKGEL